MLKIKKVYLISGAAILVCIIALVLVLAGSGSVSARVKRQIDSGNKYLSEGNGEGAIQAFKKAIWLNSESVEARLGLAEAYITLESTEEAVNVLKDVINISPERPEPYISLARICINQEDYEKALEILREGKEKTRDEKILEMLDELVPKSPKASVESGKYNELKTIDFEGLMEHDEVYYTLDGSEPNKKSFKYESPILISDGVQTLRAVTYRYGIIAGEEAKYEYEIELPSYVVEFTDKAFEKALRKIINKPEAEIRNTDLLNIGNVCIIGEEVIIIDEKGNKNHNEQPVTNLHYSEFGFYINRNYYTARGEISCLDDLNLLSGAEHIEILYQDNLHLNALINLTNLRSLILERNRISDIGALANLDNLKILQLRGNQISDISALSRLKKLTDLVLSSNQISNISALSELTNIERLDLGGNQIRDIGALSSLTNLCSLYLWDNQISDIKALANLDKLKHLDLSFNRIKDISTLSNLNNLEELDLSYNKISDVSVLSGLTRLKKLSLYNNPIPEKQLERLKKALPNCSINY